MKEIKLKALPKVGRKDESTGKFTGTPYFHWKVDVEANLDTVNGTWVLHNDPPPATAGMEVQHWWAQLNRVVFVALLHSVTEIPTLAANVRRARGLNNSARIAWKLIFDHFSRKSEQSEDYLLQELQNMRPGATESMRSYLTRYEDLRAKFLAYDVTPRDDAFVRQVFKTLTMPWRDGVFLACGHRSASDIPWETMCDSLVAQDDLRRVSNTQGPDALLPLGWTKREKDTPRPNKQGAANAGGGFPKGGEKGAPPSDKKKPFKKPVLVCFVCLEVGHMAGDCPKKPAGWKLTPEQKDKAFAKREAEVKKRAEQSRASKAAAASKASGDSSSSQGGEAAK
jgi:hypothetical protein